MYVTFISLITIYKNRDKVYRAVTDLGVNAGCFLKREREREREREKEERKKERKKEVRERERERESERYAMKPIGIINCQGQVRFSMHNNCNQDL